jgi:aspartate-semialdehyde dehydrogenase
MNSPRESGERTEVLKYNGNGLTNLGRVGVVGVTGLVGQTFLQILGQREFSIQTLRFFGSEARSGEELSFKNSWGSSKTIKIEPLDEANFSGLDFVFFFTDDAVSRSHAPLAAKQARWVIDNSASFRLDPDVPLVVPEVNPQALQFVSRSIHSGGIIIANPNCTTIQLLVTLGPLFHRHLVSSIVVASYQSVSGAGRLALEEFSSEPNSKSESQFPRPIHGNVIPQIGRLNADGLSSEEAKICQESRKILSEPQLNISAMAVRVPVPFAHSEAVWVRTSKILEREDFLKILSSGPGIQVYSEIDSYPVPTDFNGKNHVGVGRIHREVHDPHLWKLWIVADNLRRGAGWNAIQIAKKLIELDMGSEVMLQ